MAELFTVCAKNRQADIWQGEGRLGDRLLRTDRKKMCWQPYLGETARRLGIMVINELNVLPGDLPAPEDDGGADHLLGRTLPQLVLPATDGSLVDLSELPARSVIFIYPRTGQPGKPPLADNWNEIAGARGCTPQTLGYKALAESFLALGYQIYGLSTQNSAYQQELVARLQLTFPMLSDEHLTLTRSLSLPTLEVAGQTLLKRMSWLVHDGKIVKLCYPVFPPDQNAARMLELARSLPDQ
ncbi:peroxiredoxin [Pseudomonas mosselii]|uniref:Peroxiredoxin n=1 Tax=Pseudomonas mosselii TaxID=78327 RepID=A0AA42RUM0_9PSED|nr:peroxiredoxin [Pseudomonas mosselii]MDH1628866.1 peroxiredoxin [Pseudomonas mosselii]